MGNVKNEVLMDVKDSVIKLEFALGEKGVPGEKGERGEKGEPGEKGEKGEVFRKVTYTELKDLRDSELLIPGMRYCITDYEFTCNQEKSNIEMQEIPIIVECIRRYNIIVEAVSCRELSELAKACNREGEEQFDDILSWRLRYSIDNDVSKYNWADETNGKGVVYWLQDGQYNEYSFDGKGVCYNLLGEYMDFSSFVSRNRIICVDDVLSLPFIVAYGGNPTVIIDSVIEYQEGIMVLLMCYTVQNVYILAKSGSMVGGEFQVLKNSRFVSCNNVILVGEDLDDITCVESSLCFKSLETMARRVEIFKSDIEFGREVYNVYMSNVSGQISSAKNVTIIDCQSLSVEDMENSEIYNCQSVQLGYPQKNIKIQNVYMLEGITWKGDGSVITDCKEVFIQGEIRIGNCVLNLKNFDYFLLNQFRGSLSMPLEHKEVNQVNIVFDPAYCLDVVYVPKAPGNVNAFSYITSTPNGNGRYVIQEKVSETETCYEMKSEADYIKEIIAEE